MIKNHHDVKAKQPIYLSNVSGRFELGQEQPKAAVIAQPAAQGPPSLLEIAWAV
jgi:hypothetical protein